MDEGLKDSLQWLAERYEVCISRYRDRWQVELYGPQDNHELGPSASFEGASEASEGYWALDELVAHAKEWAEEPLAKGIDGRDWLRLSQAAAKLRVPARDLIRRGARELLDRLDEEDKP